MGDDSEDIDLPVMLVAALAGDIAAADVALYCDAGERWISLHYLNFVGSKYFSTSHLAAKAHLMMMAHLAAAHSVQYYCY